VPPGPVSEAILRPPLRPRNHPSTVADVTSSPETRPPAPANGIDRLLADAPLLARLRHQRVGLLTHDACRTVSGEPSRLALARALSQGNLGFARGLVRLFTPEHGLETTAPAGATVADGADPQTGLDVVSLYGPRLVPDAAMLEDLDAVIVDLRDVGVRCFTYAATAARLIAAAAQPSLKTEIIVCDRPNPLGLHVAGPPLDPDLRSFIAWFDVPFVHGRTLAGLLAPVAAQAGMTRVHIVPHDPQAAVSRSATWVAPSPALSHPETIAFYPGLVLLEGANLCEGRGTPLPFRSIGAPWLDSTALKEDIAHWALPVAAQETMLQPTTGRYAGTNIPALHLMLDGSSAFDGFAFGVRLLCSIAARHREFAWTHIASAALPTPGAESGYTVDALLGDRGLRMAIARGEDADTILARW